jgi:hypothetical protein
LARICPWWFVCMDKSIIYCRIFHMLRLSWHGEMAGNMGDMGMPSCCILSIHTYT